MISSSEDSKPGRGEGSRSEGEERGARGAKGGVRPCEGQEGRGEGLGARRKGQAAGRRHAPAHLNHRVLGEQHVHLAAGQGAAHGLGEADGEDADGSVPLLEG